MSSKNSPSDSDELPIVFTSQSKARPESSDQSAIASARSDFAEVVRDSASLSAAAHLHKLLASEDDHAANVFLSSASFNLSVLKALLQLESLGDDQIAIRLKQAEAKLAEVGRKKREQTRKAVETNKINSKTPKIMAWLLELEQKGEDIMERNTAGKISRKFDVTPTHARNVRIDYFAEKAKKAQQSSHSFV